MRGGGVLLLVLLAVLAAVFLWPGSEAPEPAVEPAPVTKPERYSPSSLVPTLETRRKVLASPLAGGWYTDDREALEAELSGFLDQADPEPLESVRALLLPHAGYRWSGRVAAYGAKLVAGRSFSRVVVLGPSHRSGLENIVSVPDVTHYATPLGEVPLDVTFIASLRRHPVVQCVPPVHPAEHSVQIQVPLLQRALGEFRLVPIVIGDLDLETSRAFARILRGLIDAETLVVASSDFTHHGPRFGYEPFHDHLEKNIESLDMGALATIERGDDAAFRSYVKETGVTICGRRAISVLLAMLGPDADARLLRYDTSGRIGGDYTNSVSYLAVAFPGTWSPAPPVTAPGATAALSDADRRRLLELAHKTLAYLLEHEDYPTPEEVGIELTAAMKTPRAVFVTLYRDGDLCGCRGMIYPSTPLYRSVMLQTVQSALYDRRFRPVRAHELTALRMTISVLTQPHPVASAEDIVLGKHGIILEKDGRRALYLPQVATEQGWNLAQTLGRLSHKAGLAADAWREGATFQVFEAEVFGEPQR